MVGRKMKVVFFSLCAFAALASVGQADEEVPPDSMVEHGNWARETKDLTLRIKRLENVVKAYIPLEEGAKVETEHEDGASIYAVTGSAWVLARAYLEAGQKDKALRMIDWLQANDSKSDLLPKKTKDE